MRWTAPKREKMPPPPPLKTSGRLVGGKRLSILRSRTIFPSSSPTANFPDAPAAAAAAGVTRRGGSRRRTLSFFVRGALGDSNLLHHRNRWSRSSASARPAERSMTEASECVPHCGGCGPFSGESAHSSRGDADGTCLSVCKTH